MARSRFDHLGTIDPAGVAKRLGADGYGIVWAVVGTGIEGTHPHFVRYENLVLTPPVRHRDFTIALAARDDDPLKGVSLDDAALAEEALFDGQGNGTHTAGLIAGVSNVEDKSVDWQIDESLAGIAPRCKLVSLPSAGGVPTKNPTKRARRSFRPVIAVGGKLRIRMRRDFGSSEGISRRAFSVNWHSGHTAGSEPCERSRARFRFSRGTSSVAALAKASSLMTTFSTN